MKSWQKKYPPYEGDEPYLYFAFAEADSQRAWKVLRLLLARGCRVWYTRGPAGSPEELLRRQARSGSAALTVLYLTDAACADKDTKSNVLVNQKLDRPILCLDPDGTDRRLSMGLREYVPHVPVFPGQSDKETESAIIHAEGFSREVLGDPVKVTGGGVVGTLSAALCILAMLLAVTAFAGYRYLHWFQPEIRDEVVFSDPVLLSAVRDEARGGAITEELTSRITSLSLDGMPESWDELALLPALERVRLPQQALADESELPPGDLTVELRGGGAA